MEGVEELIEIVAKGEGEEADFKRRASGIEATVCAMANTKGGSILVGIDDEGKIRGVEMDEEEKIVSCLQGLIPPPDVSIKKVKVNDKFVIVIKVKKSKRFVSLGSIAYIRIGRSNRPLDIEEIAILSVEDLKVSFDSLSSPASRDLLNADMVRDFLLRREKVRGVPFRGSIEDNLKKLKIVKDDSLTITGLLFFTVHPQDLLPHSGIRIIKMSKSGETEAIEEFKGPLGRLIENVYTRLIELMPSIEYRSGPKRERIPLYPEEALREALINAVAHRNYRIIGDIRIIIRDENILVRNPGSFPPGVDVENPEHIPRNPAICQFLYDSGFIERYGFGIIRMREAVSRHPFASLEILTGGMKTDVLFEAKHKELDEIERKILVIVSGSPLSSSEIAQRLGLSRVSALKRMKRLEDMNLIKKTGKGKNTRYVHS